MSRQGVILSGAIIVALLGVTPNLAYTQNCLGLPMLDNLHVLHGGTMATSGPIAQVVHFRDLARTIVDRAGPRFGEEIPFIDGARSFTAGLSTRQFNPLVIGARLELTTFDNHASNATDIGVTFAVNMLENVLPVDVCPQVGFSASMIPEHFHVGYDVSQMYLTVPAGVGIGKHIELPFLEDVGVLPYAIPQVFWHRNRIPTTILDDRGFRIVLRDTYVEFGGVAGAMVTWTNFFFGGSLHFTSVEDVGVLSYLVVGMYH